LRPGLQLVSETASAEEALAAAHKHARMWPLVDVILEDGDGLDTAERIVREVPETRVIVHVGDRRRPKAVRVLRAAPAAICARTSSSMRCHAPSTRAGRQAAISRRLTRRSSKSCARHRRWALACARPCRS